MTTKTLFERLTKENQDKVLNYEYTRLKEIIFSSLKTNYIWNSLTLLEVTCIYDCLINDSFDLLKFYNLFEN